MNKNLQKNEALKNFNDENNDSGTFYNSLC